MNKKQYQDSNICGNVTTKNKSTVGSGIEGS